MLAVASSPARSAGTGADVQFASPRVALEQGIGAYNSRNYELAIPALEFAAAKGSFFGQYFLARIYSDTQSAHADLARAWKLLKGITERYASVDPDFDRRRPFVAHAFVEVARFLQTGVPEAGVRPNLEAAETYLQHAASYFRDDDAQFELAKLYLSDERFANNAPTALHWLSRLSKRRHSGAQALLADLLWRGRLVRRDERHALALATLAVENAPGHERLWIEEIYQTIFCGSGEVNRAESATTVLKWRRTYGAQVVPEGQALGVLGQFRVSRSCADGRRVPIIKSLREPSGSVPGTPSLADPQNSLSDQAPVKKPGFGLEPPAGR